MVCSWFELLDAGLSGREEAGWHICCCVIAIDFAASLSQGVSEDVLRMLAGAIITTRKVSKVN